MYIYHFCNISRMLNKTLYLTQFPICLPVTSCVLSKTFQNSQFFFVVLICLSTEPLNLPRGWVVVLWLPVYNRGDSSCLLERNIFLKRNICLWQWRYYCDYMRFSWTVDSNESVGLYSAYGSLGKWEMFCHYNIL